MEFENFAAKSKDNPFLSNLLVLRMRFFHYKELLKIYAINHKRVEFSGARNSMYAFLVLPSVASLAFNLFSPFSLFRSIAIYSSFGGCFGSFIFNLGDELGVIAMHDKTD